MSKQANYRKAGSIESSHASTTYESLIGCVRKSTTRRTEVSWVASSSLSNLSSREAAEVMSNKSKYWPNLPGD